MILPAEAFPIHPTNIEDRQERERQGSADSVCTLSELPAARSTHLAGDDLHFLASVLELDQDLERQKMWTLSGEFVLLLSGCSSSLGRSILEVSFSRVLA